MLNFKGVRFPIEVILVCIRWYVAYPLSYRHLEEMMQERGVLVDHSSINRWSVRFLPHIEKMDANTSVPSATAGQAGQYRRLPADGEARHGRGAALLR